MTQFTSSSDTHNIYELVMDAAQGIYDDEQKQIFVMGI